MITWKEILVMGVILLLLFGTITFKDVSNLTDKTTKNLSGVLKK